MNKSTKEAWTGGKNISSEALQKRRRINQKIFKFGCLPIFCFFGLILLANYCSGITPGEKDYERAISKFDNKDFQDALININEAILRDSTNSDFYKLRGMILHELQDTLQSKEDFDKTLKLAFSDDAKDQKIKEMIEWDINHNNYDHAKELLKREVMLYSNDPKKHIGVIEYAANQYFHLKDTLETLKLYEQLILEYPDTTRFKNQTGILYISLGKNKKAIKEFSSIVTLEPSNNIYLYNLGISYLRVKNKRKAKEVLKRSMELGNKDACQEYRELTAKIRYTKKSKCCDGSLSNSIGRGACSHHRGVCGIVNIPYKEYTIYCN